jgi:hypothetical protein
MNWTYIARSPTDQQWISDTLRAKIIAMSYLVSDAIDAAEADTPATPSEYEAYIYRDEKWLMVGIFNELATAQAATEQALWTHEDKP